jgi:hypothetical protein
MNFHLINVFRGDSCKKKKKTLNMKHENKMWNVITCDKFYTFASTSSPFGIFFVDIKLFPLVFFSFLADFFVFKAFYFPLKVLFSSIIQKRKRSSSVRGFYKNKCPFDQFMSLSFDTFLMCSFNVFLFWWENLWFKTHNGWHYS